VQSAVYVHAKKNHQTALRTTHEMESKQNTKTRNTKELVYLFKLLHKSQRITREANGSLIIMFSIYNNNKRKLLKTSAGFKNTK